MLDPLATQAEAAQFGVAVTDAALRSASTRIRTYARQQVTRGQSTVNVPAGVTRLPQRPAVAVVSAVDRATGADVEAELDGQYVTVDRAATVTYTHGWSPIPDGLVELCVNVAARIQATPSALVAGIQQETGGSETVSYGYDAANGAAGLRAGEKAAVDAFFPHIPAVVVMRS